MYVGGLLVAVNFTMDELLKIESILAHGFDREERICKVDYTPLLTLVRDAKRQTNNMVDRLNSIRLMLIAHPHYTEHSEFEDQVSFIDDLIGPTEQISRHREDENGFPVCNCGKPISQCPNHKS